MRFLPDKFPRMNPPRTLLRGFTLIELLVVVAVIALLIGIMIPALGHIKKRAYETNTRATMSGIVSACASYYETFHAYPGPLPPAITVTAGNPNKVSGAQNLLLGLNYAMTDDSKTVVTNYGDPHPDNITIPGITSAYKYVDVLMANGPINFSTRRPDGKYEQLPKFFNPQATQLSPSESSPPQWPVGGVRGIASTGNAFNFPVVLDAYPDAMPILYYRKLPTGGFDIRENAEYTGATALVSSNGTTYDQTKCNFTTAFPTMVTGTPSFVLIAAGGNRMYGYTPGSTTIIDGIVMTGGF
jgi:prepilin-type N-terminal cleavage/methylation domain-containing protein